MKKLLIIFFLSTVSLLFAQKEANYWYFGRKAGIDFSSGTPVTLSDGKITTEEGCSSISDKNGNLLFYSDGIKVYTKSHELMKYSDGRLANDLQGNPSSTQSGLIVPNPENKKLYYLFTIGTDYVGNNLGLPINPGFNYYTIDISKGNGGEIIAGPFNLTDGRNLLWSEKVTAVQGDNCNEIWILSVVQNTFYAYKINKNGVSNSPVVSQTSFSLRDKRGYLKVSPDGQKIALADYNAGLNQQSNSFQIGNSQLILFDFNTSTGKVSNGYVSLINPLSDGAPYGVEFSQQSNKLYTATHDGTNSKIFQFDVTNQDIVSTKTLINEKTGFRGALQLAPDSKIYATVPISYQEGTQYLDVIENPDAQANDVTYTSNAIKLNGVSTQGLPPFIQSFFAPTKIINVTTNEVLNSTNQYFCIGEGYTIRPQINDPTATFIWLKDNIEIAKTSSLTVTNNNFGSGLYEVRIQSASECKKTFTGKVKVSFEPKPLLTKIPPYIQCDFDSNPLDGYTSFNLQSKESELMSDTSNINFEFFEVSDTSFSSPLNKINYTNTVATNHKILVKATNTNTGCYQTEIINLEVNATSPDTFNDENICELDKNALNSNAKFSIGTDNGFLDFSIKTKKIIDNSGNALSLATHNFQYYQTAQDASLQTNEIIPPYEDDLFTNNSKVFVRISNKNTNACETFGSFKIFIEKLPIPKGDLNERILCVGNPKNNLQTQFIELNADTGLASDTYKWYVNGNLITKSNSAIHKATIAGEYKVEAYRKHPNINNCIGYNTFYVKESNKALVVNVKTKDNQGRSEKNSIEIFVEGIGDYEYALNSTNLSDFKKGTKNLSFNFTDIKPGLNRIYIRDRNECGITATKEISIIYFQRHFSPNEDGYLDRWNVLGINNDFYDIVSISIFNRQGVLLKKITNKSDSGWNGRLNGQLLPSNDYWFTAKLIDKNGLIREETGHFSLIRR